MIRTYFEKVVADEQLDFAEALQLAAETNPAELYEAADELRKVLHQFYRR